MKIKNKYYIYIYLDPRKPGKYSYEDYCFLYEPFYVGKGSGDRMFRHLKEDENNTENTYKYRKIRNITKSFSSEPIVMKIKENLTEVDAYDFEKKLIFEIGRGCIKKGPLTNISEGGENPPNFYDLPVYKQEEIRQKFRNKKYSKETIEKRRLKNLGKKRTNEFKEKLSESRKGEGNPMYGKKCSENHKKKTSNSLINKIGKVILQFDLELNIIKEYPSAHEIERQLGYKFGVICRACRGERKTAYSFIWKYKN